jgi:predicted  nucleic acid-binding Zn-ribbon protein
MLDTLSEVQALDLQSDALVIERNALSPHLIAARNDNEALLQERDRLANDHEGLRRRVASNELDLKALQERRKEASDAALRASSNKEMAQYQNQELQFANRAQELEEDTLPLMESLEQRAAELAALEARLAAHAPELANLEQAEAERVADIDRQLADLRDRRERLGTQVDAAFFKVYEQVRRSRRGLALVGLQSGQRCGGCHVQLPIHVVQKVRKGVGVTRCPSCGRILYESPAGSGA